VIIISFMESKKILGRYEYYSDALGKIAKMELLKIPTIELIGASGSLVQRAYNEIKELKKTENFDGNIIDYLCVISLEFVLFQINPSKENLNAKQVAERIIKCEWKDDVRNALRIFMKNPYQLFETLSDKRKFSKEAFNILSNEWFSIVNREWNKNHK
jgi:hypothetical protein